jgi:hypothetical protein
MHIIYDLIEFQLIGTMYILKKFINLWKKIKWVEFWDKVDEIFYKLPINKIFTSNRSRSYILCEIMNQSFKQLNQPSIKKKLSLMLIQK